MLTAALTIFFTILASLIWFIGVWVHGAGALVHDWAGALIHEGAGALEEGRSASLPAAVAALQGTGTSLQGTNDLHDMITALMDLAKLTLGAFIGSFVQRNISSQKPSPPNGQDQ
ncbi:MAG: hypothetical protein CR217_04630 [Beijerinckiaceae bacterium]|nr:MAG: hypothetical protein CR217_04630 [Beijerinckiaceae bacterium]